MSLPKYSVYVGYDSREQEAYDVCEFTLKKYNGVNVEVHKLDHRMLRRYNWFYRRWLIGEDGQYWDEEDGKPFSTEFSHSRFLAPYIAKRHYAEDGWILFCDCDFMFRAPLDSLFEQVDDKYAAMCVKFDFTPKENKKKMDGMLQSAYPRKLWSSFVLWNMGHPSNKAILDPIKTNKATGASLHSFSWLKDEEIGEINEGWNFIPGISVNTEKAKQEGINVKAVHFSEGGPWFPEYKEVPFADEWFKNYKDALYLKTSIISSKGRL